MRVPENKGSDYENKMPQRTKGEMDLTIAEREWGMILCKMT